MNKDNLMRIIGAVMLVISLVVFVGYDVDKLVSIILGIFVGVGLSLISSGENIKFFEKQVFLNKKGSI